MKKLNVMIYAETLEALCELPNEDVGALVKHINDWNNGKEVVIENPFHKGMWKVILPDLERNKETYLTTLENRQRAGRENGKLGGRPRKDKETQENPIGFLEKVNNPNSNYNSNYNNNSSKEELLSGIEQPKSSEDDSVVSKGLEKLESIFPVKKNSIDIDSINLWNSLTQQEKQTLIQRATVYIRDEKKNEDGKYIKQLSKWLKEQKDKGIEPKSSKMFNSTKSDDPRLFKHTDGSIYTFILDRVNNSTSRADEIYHKHNKKELYSSKEEMIKALFDYFNNKN
jgi:hypothetical protein